MIETIIVLFCPQLEDYKFREAPEIAQHANVIEIRHYPEEYAFDVKGLYKTDDSNCYWVSISPAADRK